MKRTLSLLLALVMLFGALASLTSCGVPKNSGAEINVYLGAQIFDFDPSDYYVSANAEQVLSLISTIIIIFIIIYINTALRGFKRVYERN